MWLVFFVSAGDVSGNQDRDGKISREGRGVVVFVGEGHVVLDVFEGGDVAGEGHGCVAGVVFENLLDVGEVVGFGEGEVEVHYWHFVLDVVGKVLS